MIPWAEDKLAEAREHALAEYPNECCGIVIGKPDHPEKDIIFQCTNIQNQLHEQDPQTYRRDARTAYFIDPGELMRIMKKAAEQDLVIKLFYHSHPEHDAYFSEEDKQMALFDNEPAYPDARYLVISVYNREIRDQAFFEWNPETQGFEKLSL
ncbi:MAG: M67 family peptidase [Nitrospina sp.]|nr:MAG: M67 family peptidase [Nitrospina sp.]TDJ52782.1 MAG: M67 family peptidase [Nitrospina sp.]TDJ58300.1 MAG: M67 family peptidase [Nitrospina sp.]